ncbi:hypothetical protein IHQ91_10560 [Bifidobacterium dentium]|nr:hypothetical protein [Bifidobacterium dentium]
MAKSLMQMHWDYFLLLEKDLITIVETIELCKDNNNAYGPCITQLILSSGSELDVALKSFTTKVSPNSEAVSKNRQTWVTIGK